MIYLIGVLVLIVVVAVAVYDLDTRDMDECGFFDEGHPTFEEWLAENSDQRNQ